MEGQSERNYLGKISASVGLVASTIGIFVALHGCFRRPKPIDISGSWTSGRPGIELNLDLGDGNVKGKLTSMCLPDGSARKSDLVYEIASEKSQWDGQQLELTLWADGSFSNHMKLRLAGEKLVGTSSGTSPGLVIHGQQVGPDLIDPPRNAEFDRGYAKACPGSDPNYWKALDKQLDDFKKSHSKTK